MVLHAPYLRKAFPAIAEHSAGCDRFQGDCLADKRHPLEPIIPARGKWWGMCSPYDVAFTFRRPQSLSIVLAAISSGGGGLPR